jgi:hypothetical protein
MHFGAAFGAFLWCCAQIVSALDAQALAPPVPLLKDGNHPPPPQQISQPLPIAVEVSGKHQPDKEDGNGRWHTAIVRAQGEKHSRILSLGARNLRKLSCFTFYVLSFKARRATIIP